MNDEEPLDDNAANPASNGNEPKEAVLETRQPQAGEHTEIEELPAVDPLQALTEELAQVKAQAAEYLDGWQRARAEFANYKRRTDAERAELIRFAGADVLTRILPVVDDFDRAIQTLPDDLKDDSWSSGVLLIQRKLLNVLESSGVKPIPVQPGDAFDPNLHEAVTHEESAEFSNGQIIAEAQRGYTMGERVLRPAMVRVAR